MKQITLPERTSGPDPAVHGSLLPNQKGRTHEGCDSNILKILLNDPRWVGRLRLNRLMNLTEFDGERGREGALPALVHEWIVDVYDFVPTLAAVRRAIRVVASMNAFMPSGEHQRYPGRTPQ